MILGLGNDLCDIRRIEKSLSNYGKRFKNRVFTQIEQEISDLRQLSAASYAKRFAAKEACAKALGTGVKCGIAWTDMEVVNLPGGKPSLFLHGGAAKRLDDLTPNGHTARIHLALSDEHPLAQAVVMIEAVPENSDFLKVR